MCDQPTSLMLHKVRANTVQTIQSVSHSYLSKRCKCTNLLSISKQNTRKKQVFFKNHIIMVFSATSCLILNKTYCRWEIGKSSISSSEPKNLQKLYVRHRFVIVIWYACLNQTPYLSLPAVVAHISNREECGRQDISIRE